MQEINLNLAVAALVVGILNALGAALKAIPWVANHYIPFFLAVAGAIAYPAIEGWSGLNVILGIGLALGAVGVHQVFQQGANIKKDGVGVFFLPALLCLFLVISPALVGCAGKQSPARVALNATGSVVETAQAAIEAWTDYVVRREKEIAELKKTDRGAALEQSSELLRQEGRVLNAYAAYQEAAKAAIAIGATSASTDGVAEKVAAAAAQLTALVSTLTEK